MSRARKRRHMIRWIRYTERGWKLGAKANWGSSRAEFAYFCDNNQSTFMWRPMLFEDER